MIHECADPDLKKIDSDPVTTRGFLTFYSFQESPELFSVGTGHETVPRVRVDPFRIARVVRIPPVGGPSFLLFFGEASPGRYSRAGLGVTEGGGDVLTH